MTHLTDAAIAQAFRETNTGLDSALDFAGKVVRRARELDAEKGGEAVAWLLTDSAINSLQVASVQRLIDRAKHAHHTDLIIRINGQDEHYEADWLKHLTRATPPAQAAEAVDVAYNSGETLSKQAAEAVAEHVRVLRQMRQWGTPPCVFAHDAEELAALDAAIAAMQESGR